MHDIMTVALKGKNVKYLYIKEDNVMFVIET